VDDYESLSHSKWECKYHVVFIPKCRRKTLFGEVRRHLGGVFRQLAQQKECRVEEGHLMPDHVHMLISIPPKYSVAQVIGYIKGKSAIHLARGHQGQTLPIQPTGLTGVPASSDQVDENTSAGMHLATTRAFSLADAFG
jgi:putative transposase